MFAQVFGAALLAWGLLEALYALNDRPRPEEAIGAAAVSLNGHSWAHLHSFPSGHMAITAALAVAIAIRVPAPALRPLGATSPPSASRASCSAPTSRSTSSPARSSAPRARYAVAALVARYRSRAASTRNVSRTERNELGSPA